MSGRRRIPSKIVSSPHSTTQTGFSLVEVTLALGVVTVTMLSLMGLLSVGMQNSQQSARRDAKGDIAQSILGTVQLSQFEKLEAFHNSNFFYDVEGTPLSDGDQRAVYRAQTRLAAADNQAAFAPSHAVATNVIIDVWAVADPTATNRTVRLIVAGD